MKRMVCLLLCLALALPCVTAMGEKEEYTLPQKLLLQFVENSGVKGAVSISTSGEQEWAKRLAAFNGRNIQFTMLDGIGTSSFQYMLYLREDGKITAKSEILSDGNGTGWITSEFLPDTLISFPVERELLSSLTGLDSDNPVWFFSALRMLLISDRSWHESWEPRLGEAFMDIDAWMNALSGTPEVLNTEEGKRMLYHCEIAVDELKQQVKTLVSMLLGNPQLMSLLVKQVSLEEEALYLHEGYQWYYDQCIDQLPLTGSIVLERQVTAMGETVSTLISLPIAGLGTLKEIDLAQKGKASELSLIFADKTLVITGEKLDDDTTEGELRYQAEGEKSIYAHYTLDSAYEEGTDDSGRNTETYVWRLSAQPAMHEAEENALDFAPIELESKAYFSSKPGAKLATNLKWTMDLKADDCHVQAAASVKSSNDWELPEAPSRQVTIKLEELTGEERAALWQDWLENFALGVSVMPAPVQQTPAPTATPEPEITVIPLVELTEAPAEEAEPTEAPAA